MIETIDKYRVYIPCTPLVRMVSLSTMCKFKQFLALWINEMPGISIKCKNKSSIFRVPGVSLNKEYPCVNYILKLN
jgi:hypothetical protein